MAPTFLFQVSKFKELVVAWKQRLGLEEFEQQFVRVAVLNRAEGPMRVCTPEEHGVIDYNTLAFKEA